MNAISPAALATAKEEYSAAQASFGPEHPAVVRALLDIGLASQANGLPDESQKAEGDAQALLARLRIEAELHLEDLKTADLFIFEADRLWNLFGDIPDVLGKFSRAIAIREKQRGSDHPETAEALARLAEVHNLRAHFAEAEPLYRRAVLSFEKAGIADDPHVEKSLQGAGPDAASIGTPGGCLGFYRKERLAWADKHRLEETSPLLFADSSRPMSQGLGRCGGRFRI